MNDYERALKDIIDAINSVDAIDGVDPDIEDLIVTATDALDDARRLAAARA